MEVFNAAMLFTDHGEEHQTYRKIHLVPYGEYLPLRRFMPEFVENLIPGDLAVGRGRTVFTLPQPALRFGTLVCFEDTDGDLTRDFVKQGAQLLVNITNDSWFGESEGAEQHLANARLRAVEERRPLLRCTNSGVTAWVDTKGRVDRWLTPFLPGFVSRVIAVPSPTPPTFYARNGDWVAWLSFPIAAAALLWRWRRRARAS
jgi:apolipoprotein N-acyltransferase